MEQIAPAAAIDRRAAERRGKRPSEESVGRAEAMVAPANAGDWIAQRVLAEAVATLADILSQTAAALGPMPIVTGEGLARAGRGFLDALTEQIAHRLHVAPVPNLDRACFEPWSQEFGPGATVFVASAETL